MQGFNTGLPDGLFGRKTAEALRAYQKDNKLETTGFFDQYTIKALDNENTKTTTVSDNKKTK